MQPAYNLIYAGSVFGKVFLKEFEATKLSANPGGYLQRASRFEDSLNLKVFLGAGFVHISVLTI